MTRRAARTAGAGIGGQITTNSPGRRTKSSKGDSDWTDEQAEDVAPSWYLRAKVHHRARPGRERWIAGEVEDPLSGRGLQVKYEVTLAAGLGRGEHSEASPDGEVAKARAWWLFLRACTDVEPRLEADLREIARDCVGDRQGFVVWSDGREAPLWIALDRWQLGFSLGKPGWPDWPRRFALETLRSWIFFPEANRKFPVDHPVAAALMSAEGAAALWPATREIQRVRAESRWDPVRELRVTAEHRIMAEWKARLALELERIALAYRGASNSADRAPKRRATSADSKGVAGEAETYRWLALRLLRNYTYKKIAESRDVRPIRWACQELATYLGLPSRR